MRSGGHPGRTANVIHDRSRDIQMSAFKVLVAALDVSGLTVTQSLTMTISNRDKTPHMIYVYKSTVPDDVDAEGHDYGFLISGRKSLKESCVEGCSLPLAGSIKTINAKGDPSFVISRGKLKQLQK